MSSQGESSMDRLWGEYGQLFEGFDDHTLARWMAQTLGQIEGRAWRLSHPLLSAYRLAALVAHERQIWFKRLVSVPSSYGIAECCRAPFLPLFTRDVLDSGLICQHCSATLVLFADIPSPLNERIATWAREYAKCHGVAHWDLERQSLCTDYDDECDQAAEAAETMILAAVKEIIPQLLELFPTLVWEDQDECLEIRPEDLIPDS